MNRIHFEDIHEGHEFVSARRTVTEADIVNFAGISGDYDQLHMDELFIHEHTPFRTRIAHGPLVFAIQSGLGGEAARWQVLGYVGFERRLTGPTYPGDTLQVHYRVTSTRRSRSVPDAGVVTLHCDVVNQHGEVVQTGEDVYLVLARE